MTLEKKDMLVILRACQVDFSQKDDIFLCEQDKSVENSENAVGRRNSKIIQ